MRFAALFLLFPSAVSAAEALVQDRTHESQVLGESRNYRIFLPPDYGTSNKRYPVVYWFHGYSERHNKPAASRNDRNYDQGSDYGGDTIAAYVGSHDVIVVKWDGYNPRTKDEKYPRPYNISPVETAGNFLSTSPSWSDYIDASYRTIADREHRATAGLSMGGFMSFWIVGQVSGYGLQRLQLHGLVGVLRRTAGLPVRVPARRDALTITTACAPAWSPARAISSASIIAR